MRTYRATTADHYASELVSDLVTRYGYSVAQATSRVQKSETKIRGWFRDGIPAKVAVGWLHGETKHRGRGRPGRADSYARVAPDCRFIPIEAFMVDEPPSALPKLDKCAVAGMAKGFARGLRGRAVSPFATETAFSTTQQGQMLADVFGRPVAKDELEEAFSGVSVDGVVVRPKVTSIYRAKKPAPDLRDVTISFELRARGEMVGRMKRRFVRVLSASNRLEAEHSIMEIDRRTPNPVGKGVGETITRNSLLWEKRVGIHSISLHAAWVGRYVWASLGWQWDGEEGVKKWRELLEYVDERLGKYALVGSTILHGEFDFGGDFRAFREHVKKIVTRPWDLASLHLKSKSTGDLVHVGKVFLAGIEIDQDKYAPGEGGAEEWEGRLILRDGHPTYERAKKKLGL